MTTNKFPRSARILNSAAYSNVFNNVSIKVSNKHILMLTTITELNSSRLGLIVSKKNVKRAVDRNRFKRLIRESYRNRRNELPPLDIVVMARKGVEELDNKHLALQLAVLWSKLQRQFPSS